jgi:hypothetical protein
MEMSAESRAEEADYFRGDLVRLDRAQSDPGTAAPGDKRGEQICETGNRPEIMTVGADMDAGEHYFGATGLYKPFKILNNGTRVDTARSAPRMRDDTIRTPVVATVLDFKEPPGPPFYRRERHASVNRDALPSGGTSVHDPARDRGFIAITEDEIHTRDVPQFLGTRLRVASRDDDLSSPRATHRGPDRLSALIIAFCRHRAGIDDVNVCFGVEGNDRITFRREVLKHRVSFILIDLASEGRESYSHVDSLA